MKLIAPTLVALVAWLLLATPEAPRSRGAAAADEAIARCRFAPGVRLAFEVEDRTTVALDLRPVLARIQPAARARLGATPAQTLDVQRRWRLDLEAVGGDAAGTVFAARIEQQAAQDATGAALSAPADLDRAFLVRVGGDCAVEDFARHATADVAGARRQQAMLAGLGFHLPAGGARIATGFDVTGRYRARYTATRAGVDGRILGYDALFGGPDEARLGRGAIRVERAGGWFDRLTLDAALTYTVEDVEVGTQTKRLDARAVAPSTWQAAVDPADGAWRWGLLLDTPDVTDRAAPRADLADVPVGQMVDRIRGLMASGIGVADYAALLEAWLIANPAAAGEIAQRLRAGAFADQARLRAALFFALGAANTAEARAALHGLFADAALGRGMRVQAALALSRTHPVPAGFAHALDALVEDETLDAFGRGSMALALGALAKHQAAHDPAVAAEARAAIGDWLAAPRDAEHLAHALQAAGNAGDMAEAVAPWLADSREEVRATAARALRSSADEATLALIEARLAEETSGAVRRQLLGAALAIGRADGPLPASLRAAVVEGLPARGHGGEFAASVQLLGVAARTGDAEAEATLQRLLAAEMRAERRDPDRIAALGRQTGTRWRAP